MHEHVKVHVLVNVDVVVHVLVDVVGFSSSGRAKKSGFGWGADPKS